MKTFQKIVCSAVACLAFLGNYASGSTQWTPQKKAPTIIKSPTIKPPDKPLATIPPKKATISPSVQQKIPQPQKFLSPAQADMLFRYDKSQLREKLPESEVKTYLNLRRLLPIGTIQPTRDKDLKMNHDANPQLGIPLSGRPVMYPTNTRDRRSYSIEEGSEARGQGEMGDSGTTTDASNGNACSAMNLASLTPQGLVSFLRTHDERCMKVVWDYNENIQHLYNNQNMLAVAAEINSLAANYNGTNELGLLQLVEFLKVAYYQAWYEKVDFNGPDVDNASRNAFLAVSRSTHFLDDNNDATSIAYYLITALYGDRWNDQFAFLYNNIIQTFLRENNRFESHNQRRTLYNVLYNLTSFRFFNIHPDIISSLGELANKTDLDNKKIYLVLNAIYIVGEISRDSSVDSTLRTTALAYLTSAYHTFTGHLEPQLWIIKSITNTKYGKDCSSLSDGTQVCWSKALAEAKKQIFPNTYSFDDGRIIIQTPLPTGKIQKLYYASKEVSFQHQRATGRVTPVPNDPNEKLKIYIYNNPDDWDSYQPLLFDLDSDCGGIYIEDEGTFYSYERLPSESVYTLEELFRHEFTHYLQGRYLIQGMWGSSPLYADSKLLWFSEGAAEFFDYSTRKDGIKLRKIMFSRIQHDGNNRLSVADVVHATSSYDFKLYRYGYALIAYLYQNDRVHFKSLINAIVANDAKIYSNIVNALATDSYLETSYQSFIDNGISQLASLDSPTAFVPNLRCLSMDSPETIQQSFIANGFSGTTCSLAYHINPRFSCTGTLPSTSHQVQTWIDAWSTMNTRLDSFLTRISDSRNPQYSGNTIGMVCSFYDLLILDWGGNQHSDAHFNCEGPLNSNYLTGPKPGGRPDSMIYRCP
ncbi:MAG: collagenase [Deltaproteobacteria bacterium]|nr:collagenase [Deltaproteobacteria bacterium]